MPRPLIFAASAFLAVCAVGEAAASCQPRLQNVAQRVSELPPGMPDALMDRLTELYDEALELEDVQPVRCLALVAQMEVLLAERGGAGASGGAATADAAGLPGGQATIETQEGRHIAETPVLPVPPLVQRGFEVRGQNAFTQSVVEYWTGSSVWERGRLLHAGNGYIEALREAAEEVVAAEDDEAEKRRKARAASEAIHAIEVYQHVVLVNEPEDMLAARQADALRRLRDSARRALVQWTREDLAREEADEDLLVPPRSPDDGDLLVPPRSPGGDDGDLLVAPRSSAGDDGDLLVPPPPRDNSVMGRIRRRIAEVDAFLIEEVRKVAPWLEDRGGYVEP